MKNLKISTFRSLIAPSLGLAALLLPGLARAAEDPGSSFNFTPVLLPKDDYRVGGGTDPELTYSRDLSGVRWSAGRRVGADYANDLFGVTVMPTLRVMLPLGAVDRRGSHAAAASRLEVWIPSFGSMMSIDL